MNICFVANKFPVLGRNSDSGLLWPIARALVKLGHTVTVIAARSPMGRQEVFRDGVRAFYLFEENSKYSHLSFSDAAYEKFKELQNNNYFDIAHSIDTSGLTIAKNKKEFKIKMAFDVDATQMSQLFSIIGLSQDKVESLLTTFVALIYKFLTTYLTHDRLLLKLSDGIFCSSPEQRIALERYYLYPEFHTYLVPYASETGLLSIKEPSPEIREQLHLNEDSQIVVTVTDFSDLQEIKNLLTAFEKLAIKKQNTHLIIIGNGPQLKNAEFELLNLALGNRVHLIGALNQKELSDYIAISNIFVNMSLRSSSIDPAMIEAMAQMKIVIGAEMSSISHIIEDGVDGFLLRPADTKSLGELFIKIFSGQLNFKDIGEKARQKALNLFDVNKMAPQLVSCYEKIIKNSR